MCAVCVLSEDGSRPTLRSTCNDFIHNGNNHVRNQYRGIHAITDGVDDGDAVRDGV